jgi:AraC-like DNA-binding protein
MQEGIGLQLTVNLLRQVKSSALLEKSDSSLTRDNIKKAVVFLNGSYNKDIHFEDIARTANLSPYHFIRVFKDETGMTPHEYLLDIRIQRVKEKLADINLSVSQAFSECGMDYNGHFASLFKRKVGVTPSQYREEITGYHQYKR